MEDGENAGPVAVQIINNGTVRKGKESSEDLKAKENGEKESKAETEAREEKEKGALTVETYGTMRETAHIPKEKEKERPSMNLLKETIK